MKIADSNISMESMRNYNTVSLDSETVTRRAVVYEDTVNVFKESLFESGMLKDNKLLSSTDEKEITDTGLTGDLSGSLEFLKGKYEELMCVRASKPSRMMHDMIAKIREQCLSYLLTLLFGKNAALNDNGLTDSSDASENSAKESISIVSNGQMKTYDATLTGHRIFHMYAEEEETTFTTTGSVVLENGESFDFNLNLTMSRSFKEYYDSSVYNLSEGVTLLDPLVVNLEGNVAEFSDQSFYFDLDEDGIEEKIKKLCDSSGFLALDKNGDGEINDGSELFGTKSGDGFKDLSEYDLDGNNFIDENDEIFDKLKIFVINEKGEKELYSLKDKNVGAIYLGSRESEFSLKDDYNNTDGIIRKTGVFLFENGKAGTMQHLDIGLK